MSIEATVVIPTRNRRRLLERTLASVLAQKDVAIEVIVIDEASDDGTASFLASLDSNRVTVVRHEAPLGVAGARNVGLARAQSPWTAFVDDDDLWAPDKLSAQIAALSDKPSGWSSCTAVVIDEELRILGVEPAPPSDVAPLLARRNVIPGGGSSVVASTETLRSLGGFDEKLSVVADWELWLRLAGAVPFVPVARPLVGYLRHRGGMSGDVARLDEELCHVQQKHGRAFEGGRLDWDGWNEWRAVMGRRSRRRVDPARVYLSRLKAERRPRDAVRLLLAVAWPGWTSLRERVEARRVPAQVRAEAEAWLGEMRGR